MDMKPNRRAALKMAGVAAAAAVGVTAQPTSSAAQVPEKPKIVLPKSLAGLNAANNWHQGPVYYVCGNANANFVFGIVENGTGKAFGIDTTGRYGEFAVRVVFLAYEKGLQVSVYEDPAKPGWAQSVIA